MEDLFVPQTYSGPPVIGNENDMPAPTFKVKEVIDRKTKEVIKIKAHLFDSNIHQEIDEEPIEGDLENLKMHEVRKLAKEKGVKVSFKDKKIELISKIYEATSLS